MGGSLGRCPIVTTTGAEKDGMGAGSRAMATGVVASGTAWGSGAARATSLAPLGGGIFATSVKCGGYRFPTAAPRRPQLTPLPQGERSRSPYSLPVLLPDGQPQATIPCVLPVLGLPTLLPQFARSF
jgi:hypothetical protein